MTKYRFAKLTAAVALTCLFTSTRATSQELFVFQDDRPAAEARNEVAEQPRLERTQVTSRDSLLQRYQDDAAASLKIRQLKAQQRAAQRQARIDSAKWYGHSPLRPVVSSLPYMETYSPIIPAHRYGYIWTYHNVQVPVFYGPGTLPQ